MISGSMFRGCVANAGKNGIAPYIIPNEVISKLFLEYLEKLRLEQYDEGSISTLYCSYVSPENYKKKIIENFGKVVWDKIIIDMEDE